MAEHSVKLPEPRSDDSEDVVWGLSTASALWARGERRDAVVWIRRAAEAAEAAGNPFRASELGMYLPDLEKALQALVATPPDEPAPVSDSAPISSFEVVLDGDTPQPPLSIPPLVIPPLGPVTASPAPVVAPAPPAAAPTPPLTPPPATPATEPAPIPPTMPPAAATPPTMPPAGAAPAPTTPVPAPPAVTNQSPVSGRQTPIPSVPTPSTNQAKVPPPAATNLRPQATVPRARTASQVGFKAVTVPQRPPSDAPAARPPTPPVEDPPSIDDGRSALPPPAPLPQVSLVASAPTAAAVAAPSAPAVTAANAVTAVTPVAAVQAAAAGAAPQKRKQILRTPILDPWSEASSQEVSPRERRRRQGVDVGTTGVARPRSRMLLDEEEEDVITSAAPLAETLGKKHQGGAVVGGTGLAATPAAPARAPAAAPLAPPPLPPRAPAAAAPTAGGRPPPLPPAVATPTPAPPVVAPAAPPAPASTKAPSQPPLAATPVPPPVAVAAPTSAKNPTPAPPAPPAPVAPTSAKNPTPAPPAPPAPAGPTSAKAPTQPPPPPVAPVSLKPPIPPPVDEVDEDGWTDGTEAPRKLMAEKNPPAAPEPPAPPVPSQRAKPATDAPDQAPQSDIVPTAPRPVPRRSPTIPPAPKLPTGTLGKPQARPNAPADDAQAAAEEAAMRKFTDTLPSGITLAALKQAEAEAAVARPKPGIPPPPAGTKPLFEITKRPVPAPAVPRAPTPAPRPATLVPKAPTPSSNLAKQPPPPSVGSPPAPSAKSKSSLPPPPVRESIAPPADPIRISNVELRGVEPFSQLPEEAQRTLVRTAIIEDLVPGEARTSFGAVLVVGGEASICAVNLDVPVKLAPARSFVASRGSLAEPVPMRILGSLSGATISRWSTEAFDQALSAHPRAAQDCRAASDALQARIGLTLGPLAEVDLVTREEMLTRLEVRVVEANEVITEEDGPMPGLVFVVGGSVEILEGDPAVVIADVRPGDLLFPEALWAGAAAPLQSRAAASGALLLVGDRKLALDFAEKVPIVGELLSR